MLKQIAKRLSIFARRPALALSVLVCLSLFAFNFILPPGSTHAVTNPTLNFQARVLNKNGSLVADGNYNVEFKIYSGASCNPTNGTGCTANWTEDWYYGTGSPDNRLAVADGYLTANLGSITAFNSTIPWGSPLWLSINICGTAQTGSPTCDGAMTPYLTLTSVPAAMSLTITNGTNTGSLIFGSLTGNETITLPDDGTTETVCYQGDTNCSFAPSSGSNNYVQLQGSTPGTAQTGNFNISGTGEVNNVNTSGSVTNGILFTRNGAGGITGNGINITNTAGTLSNGLTLTATSLIGNGIDFTGAGGFTDLINAPNFTVTNAGVVTLQGSQSPDITVATQGTLNANGNSLTLQSGAGNGTGAGGALALQAANSGATSGAGGSITLTAGNAVGSSGSGGNITLTAGTGTSNASGSITVGYAGTGSTTAFTVLSASSSAVFTVDNTNSNQRVTVGNGTCTGTIGVGKLCTTQSRTTGSTSTVAVGTNNTINFSGTYTGATAGGSLVYLNDSSSGTNTLYGFLEDATGSTNSGATVNSYTANIFSASQAGNFVNFQVGGNSEFKIDNTGLITATNNLQFTQAASTITNTTVGNAININTAGSTTANTGAITIQSGSATSGSNLNAGTVTVDTGTQTGAGTAILNVGSTNARSITVGNITSSTGTTIQGGTGSAALLLQSGNGGTITIGNQSGSTGNTILIGDAGSTTNTDNVSINATSGANTSNVTIGGTSGTGTLTLQGQGISQVISGSATAPTDIIKTSVNNALAYQLQNSSSAALLTGDTTNMRLGVDVTYTAMSAPGTLTMGTSTSGGTLAAATYFYKVTAIDSAGGETSASPENSQVTTGTTSKVTVNWSAVTGASGYRVYRSSSTTGGSGAEVYLTTVFTNSFTDTGSILPDVGSPPLSSTQAYYVSGGVSNSNNELQLSLGGIGTATGQAYIGGTLPSGPVGTWLNGAAGSSPNPEGVYVQGRYAYIINNGTKTLQIVDISSPSSPTSVGSVSTTSAAANVYVQGKYAYVSNYGGNTLQIFDISNPSAPSSVTSINTGSGTHPNFTYVQGRYAYVVGNATTATMWIFDISNPLNPVQVGSISAGTFARAVYVQGRYAYVAENNSFNIFDVSNPANPSALGSVSTASTTPWSVIVQGRYAYVTNSATGSNGGLEIYDVSNPSNPVEAGFVATQSGSTPQGLSVQGRYAYLVNNITNTMQTIDVSNPYNPISDGTVSTGANTNPYSVYVQGRYAYVTDNNPGNTGLSGLQVFDLGGLYTQQLQAGGAEVGALQVDTNTQVFGDANIQGGVTVGSSIQANGNLAVGGSAYVQGPLVAAGGIQGGVTISGLSTPGAPTVTTTCVTSCTASYTYAVAAISASGGLTPIGSTTSISSGTPLSISISNTITWTPVSGAIGYNVYRTAVSGGGSPGSTGLLTGSPVSVPSFTDIGVGASGSTPTYDTSGLLNLGQGTTNNGILDFNNNSNGNVVTLTASANSTLGTSAPTSSYTLNLPSSAPSTGLCLETSTSNANQLVFSACANSNASITEVNQQSYFSSGVSTTTASYTPTTVGNLLVLSTLIPNNSSTGITSISTGSCVSGWSKVGTSPSASSYNRVEMWVATVSATSGCSAFSITYNSGSGNSNEINISEYTAVGVNAGTTWGVDTSGVKSSSVNTTTLTWSTLTAQDAGELYVGYAQSVSATGSSTGCATNFTCVVTTDHNVLTYNTNTAANTAYTATASQTTTNQYNSIGAIIVAFVSSTAINNSTSTQQANFNVQAATSGTVAGVLQANSSGTADILDVLQGSGSNAFSVSSGGNLTVAGTYNTNTFNGTTLTFGSAAAATISSATSTTVGTAGYTLNLQGGGGATSTTGSAGGLIVLQGGNAGGTGVNNGGDIYINGGTATSTGRAGVTYVGWASGGPTPTTGPGGTEPSLQSSLVVNNALEIYNSNKGTDVSELLFSNTSGSGDFRMGSSGGDLYWQGGGGRELQVGAYWSTVLTGDRQNSTPPNFVNGATGTAVFIGSSRDADVVLQLQGNSATQSGNLFQIMQSGAATSQLLTVSPTGALSVNNTSGTAALQVSTSTSTNQRVIVGTNNGSTGVTTPSLLVLDGGSSSTDPTEADGAMYYNVADKSFRCGQNGAWVSCSTGSVSTATANSTNNITAAAYTAFTGTKQTYTAPVGDCQAGVVYEIRATGFFNDNSVASNNIAFEFVQGGTAMVAMVNPINVLANANNYEWTTDILVTCRSTTSVMINGTVTVDTTDASGSPTAVTSSYWIPAGHAPNATIATWTDGGTMQMKAKWGTTGTTGITETQFIVSRSGP